MYIYIWKHIIHVPNHQPVIGIFPMNFPLFWDFLIKNWILIWADVWSQGTYGCSGCKLY